MKRSTKFEKVKEYYENGFWDDKRVLNAVIKEWITLEEYEEIVGVPYVK